MDSECRICGAKKLKELKMGNVTLIYCSDCKIRYLNRLPTESTLENYYENIYELNNADQLNREKRRLFRMAEQIVLVSEISSFKPAPAKLLDIGCERGYFLDEARRHNYTVSGVEPSTAARNYCQSIGIKVESDITAIEKETENKFQIITMWHSLEHISNPIEFLKKIHNLLESSGIICVRTPDFGSVWRKVFKSKWIWFQPQNHYFHYELHTLKKALQIAGFKILQAQRRKPNNRFTKTMYRLSNAIYGYSFGHKPTFRDLVKRRYEDLTGDELFVIAQKAGNSPY